MATVSFFNMLVDLREVAVLQTVNIVDGYRYRNEFEIKENSEIILLNATT